MRLQVELDEAKTLISELEAVKFEAEQEVDDMVEDHADVLAIENKKLTSARDENMRLLAEVSDLKLKLQQVNNGSLVVAGGSSSSGSGIDETDSVGKNAVSELLGNVIPQASVANKNDLKKIDGIGAFIEEKLNKIGIYTFEQISFFDDDIIEKVTDAIQFFPGRIKKDKWVEQSKALMGQNKGKLNIIEAQAMVRASIGRTIPKANADDKNDLKVIKGIGAFIEQKLNKLGIYTYEQVAAFDDNMVETITTAIEFFPDRIKRDGWVEQARKLAK
jgi:predicted flap endonuclease-1-like 5' DNA nuclease